MFGKKSTTKMSVVKRIKQEKHKEKTQEEIQNIIRSRKIAKEKGISKKDLRRMRLNKSRMRLEKKKEKSTKTTSYEESIDIMTFGNVVDSYTTKILDDYHNDTSFSVIHRDTSYFECGKFQVMLGQLQEEERRRERLEMIAQQFDEDEENFRDVEDNEYSYYGCDCDDWMLHEDNQSK